jgi:hypothetical protein
VRNRAQALALRETGILMIVPASMSASGIKSSKASAHGIEIMHLVLREPGILMAIPASLGISNMKA